MAPPHSPKQNHLVAALPEAAGELQAGGVIHYSRGHIKVLDRPKLEQRVCERYALVKKGIRSLAALSSSAHGNRD